MILTQKQERIDLVDMDKIWLTLQMEGPSDDMDSVVVITPQTNLSILRMSASEAHNLGQRLMQYARHAKDANNALANN